MSGYGFSGALFPTEIVKVEEWLKTIRRHRTGLSRMRSSFFEYERKDDEILGHQVMEMLYGSIPLEQLWWCVQWAQTRYGINIQKWKPFCSK